MCAYYLCFYFIPLRITDLLNLNLSVLGFILIREIVPDRLFPFLVLSSLEIAVGAT